LKFNFPFNPLQLFLSAQQCVTLYAHKLYTHSSGDDSREVVFDAASAFGKFKLKGPISPTLDHRRIFGSNCQFLLNAHTSSSESSRRFCSSYGVKMKNGKIGFIRKQFKSFSCLTMCAVKRGTICNKQFYFSRCTYKFF
jgi:hypothetical protein